MTSHPSPFYRQRQSNKTLDPTGQTAKFLYTILKQLDLKNIDWNEVARNLDITNGHAARMRWSRFRAQIEGLDNSYSRKGGRKKDPEKKRKKDSQLAVVEKTDVHDGQDIGLKRVKTEIISGIKAEDRGDVTLDTDYGATNMVKNEPVERKSIINGVTVHHPTMTTIHVPQTHDPRNRFRQSGTAHQLFPYNTSSCFTQSTPGLLPASFPTKLASQSVTTWPQQYFETSYDHSVHRNTNALSPFYSAPDTYANRTSYPNAFMNQVQQRHQYNPQLAHNALQQPQYHATNNNSQTQINPVPAFSSAAAYLQPPLPLSQPTILNTTPTTSSSTVQTVSHGLSQDQQSATATSQPQDHACELASQASYPWPYSEASLSQFVQQPKQSSASNSHEIGRREHHGGSGNEGNGLFVTNLSTNISNQEKADEKDGRIVDHAAGIRLVQVASGGSNSLLGQESLSIEIVGEGGTEIEKTSSTAQQNQDFTRGVYIKSESELVEL